LSQFYKDLGKAVGRAENGLQEAPETSGKQASDKGPGNKKGSGKTGAFSHGAEDRTLI
jgi:hypothetical protein